MRLKEKVLIKKGSNLVAIVDFNGSVLAENSKLKSRIELLIVTEPQNDVGRYADMPRVIESLSELEDEGYTIE